METKTIVTVIFWILIAAFAIPSYIQGFLKIISQKEKVESFKRWGYSLVFMKFLGWVEVIGTSLLIFSQTRLFSIPIFAILLSGAVYTHVKNKDLKKDLMVPIFVGIHLAVLLVLTIWI